MTASSHRVGFGERLNGLIAFWHGEEVAENFSLLTADRASDVCCRDEYDSEDVIKKNNCSWLRKGWPRTVEEVWGSRVCCSYVTLARCSDNALWVDCIDIRMDR